MAYVNILSVRTTVLNKTGLAIAIALALYSLLCIYIIGASLHGISTFDFNSADNRSKIVVDWSDVVGVPTYEYLTKPFKFVYMAALCLPLVGSLMHLYVALRTIFQPSSVAEDKGKQVKHKIIEYRSDIDLFFIVAHCLFFDFHCPPLLFRINLRRFISSSTCTCLHSDSK